MDIASFIRHVPDYPKPGILFYDITPLLASPEAFGDVIERMADAARPLRRKAQNLCYHIPPGRGQNNAYRARHKTVT